MAQLLIFSSRTCAPEPVSKILWFLDLAPLCALYALFKRSLERYTASVIAAM